MESFKKYKFMKVLRLISNLYKYDFSKNSNEELIELLQLEKGVTYAPLPESNALREGLANFLCLEQDADFCDIAEKFVDIANDFLSDIRTRTKLSKVNWGQVSLNPNDCAR